MNKSILNLLIVAVCLVSGAVLGQSKVYKYVDSNGRVQFTDRPSHDGYVRIVQSWKGWRPIKSNPNFRYNLKKYSPIISAAAKKYDLPEALIKAVIHAESHFDPYALSSAGAMGLMQLMPATAARFNVYDRQNPKQNINGGVRYLSLLVEMFNGDLKLALAAYNAGENAVKRHGRKIPPYQETRNYVSKVRRLYSKYQKEANQKYQKEANQV